jgi:TRAP-type C4-dicarboxylate transport system permease small subunit
MFLDQFEKHFMSFNRWLLILILAVMSVIIFANVTLRYTTSQSMSGLKKWPGI